MNPDKVTEMADREEYDPNEDREEYIKRMMVEGYRVVLPEPNEVFIDIDTEDDYQLFLDQFKLILRDIGVVNKREHTSRNGLPGRHITLTMAFAMTDVERIALQSVLGSDPKRELLSMVRLIRGDKHPTLFVEKI